MRQYAGIEPNKGKTECLCSGGGVAPPGIDALNDLLLSAPVWKGNLADDMRGIEVVGSPLGTLAYCERILEDKLNHPDVEEKPWPSPEDAVNIVKLSNSANDQVKIFKYAKKRASVSECG